MTEPKFVPKAGQVDYTHIRYAPVINIVVTGGSKVFLVHRSSDMRLYPDHWSGISGFLDDAKSIEEKPREELCEELGLQKSDITSLQIGQMLLQESPQYRKTWLVVPVLARVKTKDFKLDWEAQDGRWFVPTDVKNLKLTPDFDKIVDQFLAVL